MSKPTIHVAIAILLHQDQVLVGWREATQHQGNKYEFPGGKVEPGETPQQALVREIMEELDTEIKVGEWIDTIEFDYPTFHLSMDCFWAEVTKGHLELKEAEAAKWLTKDQLDSVAWLPADITLIDKIQGYMK